MALETVALVSAGVGAIGSLVQGVSQAGAANRSAAVAKSNAKVAEQQGEAEASLIRERARRLKGSNKANIGASGVDISGSFADALDDNDISSELDAQTALYNSKLQADNFRAQAKADKSSGTAGLIGGVIGAGTQALSGYGNWKLLKSMNAGGADAYDWTMVGGHGGAR